MNWRIRHLIPISALLLAGVSNGQTVTTLYGNDGVAEASFGKAISVNGDLAVVGAPADRSVATGRGSAYVFQRSAGSWLQEQKLEPTNSEQYDFGATVAIASDWILIGYPSDTLDGDFVGSVRTFRHDGTSWAQQQALFPGDSTYRPFGFGQALGANDSLAIVGSPNNMAFVLRLVNDEWVFEQTLVPDTTANLNFASSVDIYGDTAIVGAPTQVIDGLLQGAAYVFTRKSGTWVQTQVLTASDGNQRDYFGASVAVHEDVIAVGAHKNDLADVDAGAAYMFARDDSIWTETQILSAPLERNLNQFGASISLGSNVVVIGAPGHDANGFRSGLAAVSRYDGQRWLQPVAVIAPDIAERDDFGSAVAVGSGTVFVGAPSAEPDASDPFADLGAVYAFSQSHVLNSVPVKAYSDSKQVLAHPNPASNMITLTLDCFDNLPLRIDVVDLIGRRVLDAEATCVSRESAVSIMIDVSRLPSGLYFARRRDVTASSIGRFAIVR